MTETEHLIKQAARELELEDLKVEASLEQPGFYNVKWRRNRTRSPEEMNLAAKFYETVTLLIAMDAEWKSIIAAMKAVESKSQ